MHGTSIQPWIELLRDDGAARELGPQPGWCGVATLFGSRGGTIEELSAGDYAGMGVPFDSTASSRPGAAEGPDAVRRASRVFASYLNSLGEHEMFDTRTGEAFRYREPRLVDTGDVAVFPADIRRTFQSLALGARDVAAKGATQVAIGGDHSVSFPLFAGFQEAARRRGQEDRVGYIQVDHHFDFGDSSAIFGPVYHGSNSRRISELPGMAPDRIAFVGAGTVTKRAQFDYLRETGYHVVPATTLKNDADALKRLVDNFRRNCSQVYLSLDIDVLDCATAPGTGNVTCGGMDAAGLIDALRVLAELPLGAIDVVEVAPRYDPTGRTPALAAQALVELIYRCPCA